MKRILISLLLFLPVFSAQAGKIVTDSLSSKILDAEVKFNVYLPNSFNDSEKTYPVVYLLHGLYGCYEDWQEKGRMKEVADELIASGEAADMIIVMPNAGGKDVHKVPNGYFNTPGWNYEDFFFQELLPYVEAKYRCVGDKAHRAVMGLSMGGGGSTVYCQRHPDMFSSCYAMSAWLDQKVEDKAPEDPSDRFYYTVHSVRNHSALDFVDNADKETLSKLDSVRWFFDCGDDDGLVTLSFQLHMKMKAARVNSELRVRNGVHNWEYWHLALREALPFASRNFDR